MHLSGKIAGKDWIPGVPRHGERRLPRTWYVVADSAGARILSREKGTLEEIGEAAPTGREPERGEPYRQPGRTENPGAQYVRQRLEPQTAPAEKNLDRFTRELAEWLDQAVQAEAFDRLVLVAAPQTLGALRRDIDKKVRGRVVATLDKDLMNLPAPALEEALEDILLH
jgi:protein required for attachment to host cells